MQHVRINRKGDIMRDLMNKCIVMGVILVAGCISCASAFASSDTIPFLVYHAPPHVTIYTESGCSNCINLERELAEEGVNYTTRPDSGLFHEFPTTIICNHGVCKKIVVDDISAINEALK